MGGLKNAVTAAGMQPLIVAPTGGPLDGGLQSQRSYLTARSTEFDAIVFCTGAGSGGADTPGTDAKTAAPPQSAAPDSRLVLLASEAYRHAKAMGICGSGAEVLDGSRG